MWRAVEKRSGGERCGCALIEGNDADRAVRTDDGLGVPGQSGEEKSGKKRFPEEKLGRGG